MTLNLVIALTSPSRSVISLNSVALGTDYVEVVKKFTFAISSADEFLVINQLTGIDI